LEVSKSWFKSRNLIVGVIIVLTFTATIYYLNAPKYDTYSRFGFSFEYPEGMEFSEEGIGGVRIATVSAGIVQGTLIHDENPEIIGVVWIPFETKPELEDILDLAFSQLGEGNQVESRGTMVSTQKDNHDMLRQDFTMNDEGSLISGIAGIWYNPTAKRIYLTFYMVLPNLVSEQGLLKRFERLTSSFESRFEAFPETSLPVYWPTESWKTARPAEVGIDSKMLEEMTNIIREGDRVVDSVLVVKDGYLVLDEYFEPFTKGEKHKIYSCTKSVVSTLIGIAIDKGQLKGVNQTVLDFFPERTIQNRNDWKEEMTLEDLLTMTAGFDAKDSWLYDWAGLDKMHNSSDALQYVLDLEVIEEPGTRFEYTNGVSHLLSCIIQEVTGMSSQDYAVQNLFTPLGISDYKWESDSYGRNWGYSSLYLTPHDMAKFGYLFLNKGVWDGEQIVSESWVEAATKKQVDATSWEGYGYQWWIDGWDHYLALGYNGQLIFVVPMDQLVVVFTGSDPSNPGFADYLLKQYILPAVKTDTPFSSFIE
jgi:CubicO group peptidase (beta-lactamase class C family)